LPISFSFQIFSHAGYFSFDRDERLQAFAGCLAEEKAAAAFEDTRSFLAAFTAFAELVSAASSPTPKRLSSTAEG
jgi:hypothetical protein